MPEPDGPSGSKTKIVATIGPASAAPTALDDLLRAGVDVARINCAHGTTAERGATIRLLRERAARLGRPLAILADLAGPKLRIGRFRDGCVELAVGDEFVLTTRPVDGDRHAVSVDYAGLPGDLSPGAEVYLNDGLVRLRVRTAGATDVVTTVEAGGPISDRKGLAVPGVELRLESLSSRDLQALDALALDPVDWIGLSYVRRPDDLVQLRAELARRGIRAAIVAKIEQAQAVERLDAVVAAAEAVMVARGDLGVECPIHEVAVLQKRIIRACRRAGKPVITATQMLESMVTSPLPTRAEATDVANAVLDGTDAVMLSAETATGLHPVRTVQMMRRIIVAAETWARTLDAHDRAADPPGAAANGPAPAPAPAPSLPGGSAASEAIARAAVVAARTVGAEAIVCLTQSGGTAAAVARWRPEVPILALTPHALVQRRLALVWGVRPVLVEPFARSFDEEHDRVLARLRGERLVSPGARVVVTAGLPFADRPSTNTIRIDTVDRSPSAGSPANGG